jgi:RNA polymerase sigma factor (sigma-70 family)
MFTSVEEALPLAQGGNTDALDFIVRQVQPKIYLLALRMLWHPEDAKDATQEILLRIITNLGSFRGESIFFTWAYRIGANHLSGWRKSRLESQELTFEAFGKDLQEGLTSPQTRPDEVVLYQEIRVGCTLGMLLCLDRPHRLAYILGEILEMDSVEASAVLEISGASYRKRLERARRQIVTFVQSHCGLANPSNPCRCSRRVGQALKLNRVNPQQLLFAGNRRNAESFPQVLAAIRKLEETQRAVSLYRSHPQQAVPDFTAAVRNLLGSSNWVGKNGTSTANS